MAIKIFLRKKTLIRLAGFFAFSLTVYRLLTPSVAPHEIAPTNYIDRIKPSSSILDVHNHPFMQSRMGREERPDMLDEFIESGVDDFWNGYQLPL
jgi:hypothetical protein